MGDVRLSGGCQCGAVRYALHAPIESASICHCRMCQKAFGAYFAPLGRVPASRFEVTRGAIAYFRSSDPFERGFCNLCGTPLIYHRLGGPNIHVSLGSLDDPASVPPTIQYGMEARMPWFGTLDKLTGTTSEEDEPKEIYAAIRATNHQHPDHDTAEWPPPGGRHA